ncbi:MAG: DUF4129 domain-containing protein [Verrucomicrobiaceae bacterium]|nr:DUF4129 domain-containing protein [Verrucomicrobiaceae bacterium]
MTVVLRPRLPWEAVDLGCAMVRRDFARLAALWACTVFPVWALLCVFLPHSPMLVGFLIWWLKPLYDRVPLFFLSRAAFGARPGLWETLKKWPRLWFTNFLPALLWRRLSFIRSFAMPAQMLEGLRGAAVRKRVKTLSMDGGSSGVFVSYAFLKLEAVMWIALLFTTYDFLPEDWQIDSSAIFTAPQAAGLDRPALLWWSNACYMLAVSFVELFYVGAGFGLYLNCRTRIEGWDVELAFRKLAARLRPVTTVLAALGMLTLLFSPISSQAAEDANSDQPAKIAKRILESPDFTVHKTKKWEWIPDFDVDKPNVDFSFVGMIGEVLFWLLVTAAVAWVVWFIVRNVHLLRAPSLGGKIDTYQAPKVIMGMNITRESLPDDIVAAALAAWDAGNAREALSLLYRGSLSWLVIQRRVPIRDSDTEEDCLHHVRVAAPANEAGFFESITGAWVQTAYATIPLQRGDITALCAAWPFGKTQASGSNSPAVRVATVALCALLSALSLSSCKGKWEEVEKTTGYQGKARVNPFLAAERMLDELGHDASRRLYLGELPSNDAVIILSGEGGVSEGRTTQILDWVDNGGHLIYCLSGCRAYNDHASGLELGMSILEDVIEKEGDLLLKRLDIEITKWDPEHFSKSIEATAKRIVKEGKKLEKELPKAPADSKATDSKKSDPNKKTIQPTEMLKEAGKLVDALVEDQMATFDLKWRDQNYTLKLAGFHSLSLKRKLGAAEFAVGEKENAAALHLVHGSGRVTVLPHARPFRNRWIAEHDHARWLADLMMYGNYQDSREVRFIAAATSSFIALLWDRGWMPLCTLAACILFWLWRHMPRFGPLAPVQLDDTRHFASHVASLGHFYWRMRRPEVLLKAARDAVWEKLRAHHPDIDPYAPETSPTFIQSIATRCDLPTDRVKAAFDMPPTQQAHHLITLLRDLQLMRSKL